jgi:hypothetical protein
VLSVLAAAVLGFTVGIVLHAIPATAPFVYTDVLALVVAALAATLLTSLWIWIDPEFQPVVELSSNAEVSSNCFASQDKIGFDGCIEFTGNLLPHLGSTGSQVKSSDGSRVAEKVFQLLTQIESKHQKSESWQGRIIRTAGQMWRDDSIIVHLSSRQAFSQAGFKNSWSLSQYMDGTLSITVGFLDDSEIELYLRGFQDNLASL